MFLVKLPFRIAALPVILVMMVVHFIVALITGISSVITNLLGTIAIATAAGIWMFRLGTDADAYAMLAFGAVLIILPHIAEWLLDKAADVTGWLIAFVMPCKAIEIRGELVYDNRWKDGVEHGLRAATSGRFAADQRLSPDR